MLATLPTQETVGKSANEGWPCHQDIHAPGGAIHAIGTRPPRHGPRMLRHELDRLLRSVRSRSPSACGLTVSAIKPAFDSATSVGPNGSYTRYNRPQIAAGRSRCSDDCFPAARTGGADPSATTAAPVWTPQAAAHAGRLAKGPEAGWRLRATGTAVCRLALVHAARFGPFERREGCRWAGSGQHDWAR
jgi:hypothetical protein